MADTDEFEGRPWNAELTPEWNESAYWTKYYSELLADPDPWRLDHVLHRGMSGVLRALCERGLLPHPEGIRQLTVLDAGCGIAIIPEVFAYWGFAVTAVDLCLSITKPAGLFAPGKVDLAKCVEFWEPAPEGRGQWFVEDPARRLAKLREYQRNGGSIRRVVTDWHDPQFAPATFDLIHCRNSLRLSPKRYWRKSLLRFHELLRPCGVLYVESVNAIGIQDEVEALAKETGFLRPSRDGPYHDPDERKTFIGWWPTG